VTGAFKVEPTSATGSTTVSIRVANGSLDYENPNQRKFIILVSIHNHTCSPNGVRHHKVLMTRNFVKIYCVGIVSSVKKLYFWLALYSLCKE
jgi:hypothetical protein